MTPFLSWLLLGAVFLIVVAVWLVVDHVGTYAKDKISQAPADLTKGSWGGTAKDGPAPTVGENRRPISFQVRAAKGIEKRDERILKAIAEGKRS